MKLSLPVSTSLTVLAILLPLLAVLNVVLYRRLLGSEGHLTFQRRLLPIGLQAVQAILSIVLCTLFATDLVPSDALQCQLSTEWQRLWTSHDANSIRTIQDAFNCCGFNSVKDRFWPFPHKDSRPDCATQWDRTTSCAGPWMQALRASAGVDFAIVVTVGLLQVSSKQI